jgi:hypothetical protein
MNDPCALSIDASGANHRRTVGHRVKSILLLLGLLASLAGLPQLVHCQTSPMSPDRATAGMLSMDYVNGKTPEARLGALEQLLTSSIGGRDSLLSFYALLAAARPADLGLFRKAIAKEWSCGLLSNYYILVEDKTAALAPQGALLRRSKNFNTVRMSTQQLEQLRFYDETYRKTVRGFIDDILPRMDEERLQLVKRSTDCIIGRAKGHLRLQDSGGVFALTMLLTRNREDAFALIIRDARAGIDVEYVKAIAPDFLAYLVSPALATYKAWATAHSAGVSSSVDPHRLAAANYVMAYRSVAALGATREIQVEDLNMRLAAETATTIDDWARSIGSQTSLAEATKLEATIEKLALLFDIPFSPQARGLSVRLSQTGKVLPRDADLIKAAWMKQAESAFQGNRSLSGAFLLGRVVSNILSVASVQSDTGSTAPAVLSVRPSLVSVGQLLSDSAINAPEELRGTYEPLLSLFDDSLKQRVSWSIFRDALADWFQFLLRHWAP